jgi:hypothetical protein
MAIAVALHNDLVAGGGVSHDTGVPAALALVQFIAEHISGIGPEIDQRFEIFKLLIHVMRLPSFPAAIQCFRSWLTTAGCASRSVPICPLPRALFHSRGRPTIGTYRILTIGISTKVIVGVHITSQCVAYIFWRSTPVSVALRWRVASRMGFFSAAESRLP